MMTVLRTILDVTFDAQVFVQDQMLINAKPVWKTQLWTQITSVFAMRISVTQTVHSTLEPVRRYAKPVLVQLQPNALNV